MTFSVFCIETSDSQEMQIAMKNRMFGGIGVMALAFTLAVVGVDAFAQQAQAAETKGDSKLQECAKSCSDCQRVCDLCASHCANLLADGKKEHLSCLRHCRDCATCCAACSQVCASGGPLSAVMADCCAKCCDHCAKACEALPDDQHMKACAEECRKCEKACKAIAK
jgi:hypothetical protein